jgi:hypothetical protein
MVQGAAQRLARQPRRLLEQYSRWRKISFQNAADLGVAQRRWV